MAKPALSHAVSHVLGGHRRATDVGGADE
jgi:hypothetical protein